VQPEKMKSEATKAHEAELTKRVFDMRINGVTFAMIGRELDIDHRTVLRYYDLAFADYKKSHTQRVEEFFTEGFAQLDRVKREYMPRAITRTVVEKDPRTGKAREVKIPGDPKAALIILKAQRDMSLALGTGNKHQHEHTGRDGGPIETSHIGPQEAAAKMREVFGRASKPYTNGQAANGVEHKPVDDAAE
jgi:hypothetical protein